MGFTPQQVDEMSLWQYFSALNGYLAAHTPKDAKKLTASEADDLWEWVQDIARPARVLTTTVYFWSENGPVPAGAVTFDSE